MFKSITFEVVGAEQIVCDGCEKRIEKLLKGVQGVDTVHASMKNQRIAVLFDGTRLNAAVIEERLTRAGYQIRTVR